MPVSLSQSVRCAYAMLSDTGRRRAQNEDFGAADVEMGLFVVCDGMGGAAAGEVASRCTAESVVAALRQGSLLPDKTREEMLTEAIVAANRTVFTQARNHAAEHGMGTTLVALLFGGPERIDGSAVVLANVGDSRCYRLRRGELQMLSTDHSLVAEQVRFGLLSEADAATSPMQHIITRAVGTRSEVEPDVTAIPVEEGDLFLLCSDGLTRELTDAEIAGVLNAQADDLESAVRELVDRANEHGGNDNITCLLVRPSLQATSLL